MFGLTQQRRKAGFGIEARPAEPIDRTVTPDQRGGAHVSDHRVVFDAGYHAVHYAVKSTTTLVSLSRRSNAARQHANGTRRLISPVSHRRSARLSACAASR